MNLYPGIEVMIIIGTPDKRGIVREINTEDNLVHIELEDGSGCEWFFADEVQRIPKRKEEVSDFDLMGNALLNCFNTF